jgi:hypothetical protein
VRGLSRQARNRLLRTVRQVDLERFPVDRWAFVTLTYPGAGAPDDPRAWKKQLQALRRRLERWQASNGWDRWPMLWRLELKERKSGLAVGTVQPHYHLIWILPTGLANREGIATLRAWVANAWNAVVAPGDNDHLRAGTQFDQVRTENGIASYVGKYAGKDADDERIDKATGELLPVGRTWGTWHWKGAGLSSWRVVRWGESAPVYKVRRVLFRFLKLKAGKAAKRTFFCQADTVRKVVDWVNGMLPGGSFNEFVSRTMAPGRERGNGQCRGSGDQRPHRSAGSGGTGSNDLLGHVRSVCA